MSGKRKFLTILITITLFIIVSSIIYLVHKTAFGTYEFESKYTYVCDDPDNCDYDTIEEVYKELETYAAKKSSITTMIDSISNESDLRLSTKDIESSYKIALKDNLIILTVTNKDVQTATFVNFSMIYDTFWQVESDENITLKEVDTNFTKTPNFINYLVTSVVLGAVTGLILVNSDFGLKKKQVEEDSSENIA